MPIIKRRDGRSASDIRSVECLYEPFGYADGSILLRIGKTQVYCAVTLQQGVPPFLRGQGTGWLTAEYSLLPTSTQTRKPREISNMKRNGRSVEISRLISRVMRSVVNVDAIGERTITIDCDVLQADGGTRTACITASYLALRHAVQRWLESGTLRQTILTDELAAISVGIVGNKILLDIDYQEDSSVDADFNFILTRAGDVVEVQGTAEKKPVSWALFEQARAVAQLGIEQLCTRLYDGSHSKASPLLKTQSASAATKKSEESEEKAPLFSLSNRQRSSSSSR